MFISAYLFYSGVNGLIRMFGLESPYILSLEGKLTLDPDAQVDFLSPQLSTPLFGLWEGGDENPFGAVALDRESRRYISVRSRHIIKEYDRLGKMTQTDHYQALEPCTVNDFRTDFGINFFLANKERKYSCVRDATAYMQGVQDSAVLKKEHAYVVIDIRKCSEEARNLKPLDPTCIDTFGESCERIDPPCASPGEIAAWLETKRVYVRALNQKIDFESYHAERITR